MPNYNGHGPNFCKHCGGKEGIHHREISACPLHGEDQTGKEKQSYADTRFEPQDRPEEPAPVTVETTLEGRTLFDDYFIGAITGISTIFGASGLTEDQVASLFPDVVITCAYDVAKAAMKKREEYFSGVKK
jgi:hypothetical protein